MTEPYPTLVHELDDEVQRLCARLDARDEEIERLRAALRPFAEWAEQNDDGEWSDDNDALDALTYADFRRAREALK